MEFLRIDLSGSACPDPADDAVSSSAVMLSTMLALGITLSAMRFSSSVYGVTSVLASSSSSSFSKAALLSSSPPPSTCSDVGEAVDGASEANSSKTHPQLELLRSCAPQAS